MGVDLGYINQKQAELAAAAAARASGGNSFWQPQDGNNRLRLLPPWADTVKSFERAMFMHFGVGQEEQVFTCSKPAACPLCAHVEALRATGDPGDKEIANRMVAKKRYYSNIVDLGDPVYTQKEVDEWLQNAKQNNNQQPCPIKVGTTKVQIFGYGASIYGQLINLFAQWNQDLTDLNNGYDLGIMKVGAKLNTKYTVIPMPPAKPLAIVGDLTLPNLDAILPPKKPEDMLAALSGSGHQALPPGYGTPPQALTPPPAMPAAIAAPAPAPVAAPAPAAKPAAAAAAAPKQVQRLTPPAPAAEPPPPCFKDKTTFDQADAQCVGGKAGDGENFDQCPVYQECGEFSGKLVAIAKPGRRRAAPKPSAEPVADMTDADLLEKQMQQALNSTPAS